MTSYDAIIVLGAAVWPEGRPSPALERRVMHAIDLVNAGTAQHLLLTGGVGRYPPSEAHVMRQLALAAGVPVSRIVIEDQSHSTFDSALSCRHLLRDAGWKRVLLVTDRYHLPRALFTFRSLNLNVGFAGSAPPGVQITHPGARHQKSIATLNAIQPMRSRQSTGSASAVRNRRRKRWYKTYVRETLAFVWYVLRVVSWKIRQPGGFT